MEASVRRRTLIVANRTANTPELRAEIRRRAREQPTQFALLVPNIRSRAADDWTLDRATALLAEDAGGPVEGMPGDEDPFEAVKQALELGGFDDVVISTLPQRTSEWLRRDLPHRVERLGVPVTVITQRRPSVGDTVGGVVDRGTGLSGLGAVRPLDRGYAEPSERPTKDGAGGGKGRRPG